MANMSVIVPVYKVEPYLRRCVDSILGQDFENFELILVDDGSPDGCPAICDEYAQKDGRVRVIHQENTGQSTARNRAVALTEAQFITFVDGDDWIAPGYLSALYDAIKRTDAGIAAARICTEIPQPDGSTSQQLYPLPQKLLMERDEALQALCMEGVSGVSGFLCGKLIHRENALAHPFPDGRLFEDSFAVWRQVADAGQLVCVPEALYHCLTRADSSQRQAFQPRHMDLIDAVQDMMEQFRQQEMPPAVMNAGAYKVCRACYVTAYHAAELPYREFRAVCGKVTPLLREHLSAAWATGRLSRRDRTLYQLLLRCRPAFYAAARLRG